MPDEIVVIGETISLDRLIEHVSMNGELQLLDLPGMLMVHVSFYPVCLNSFLTPSFGEIISIPYRDVEDSDILNMIANEHPDVVILEFAERLMEDLIWHFSE